MTNLEKLLVHTFEQNMALVKAAGMLASCLRDITAAHEIITRQQAEIECLRLDLAEARHRG